MNNLIESELFQKIDIGENIIINPLNTISVNNLLYIKKMVILSYLSLNKDRELININKKMQDNFKLFKQSFLNEENILIVNKKVLDEEYDYLKTYLLLSDKKIEDIPQKIRLVLEFVLKFFEKLR